MADFQTDRELAELHQRVADLEAQIGIADQLGMHRDALPDSMLFSDSFLKRAFAVLGHYFVASLIIMVPVYVFLFLIMALVGVAAF
ncbi:hypothetical protein [Rubrivirga marina]|uniref:Uncharacterized protein n=1 Tax=Rubrivirga marina TaxID=1196024 RepID=A0A271J2K2_9BACT|nr:hypothetical protein [Rubrivirga marina]PAP77722.1 hypothetical protein BSZ37_15355 [Rubrivirga marina]